MGTKIPPSKSEDKSLSKSSTLLLTKLPAQKIFSSHHRDHGQIKWFHKLSLNDSTFKRSFVKGVIQHYIKYYFCMLLFDQTATLHRQQLLVASQRQGTAARQILKESAALSAINSDMTTKNSNNFHDSYCSLCRDSSFPYCGNSTKGESEFLAAETIPGSYQLWGYTPFAIFRREKDLGEARPALCKHISSSHSSVSCYEKHRVPPICCFQHSCPAVLS